MRAAFSRKCLRTCEVVLGHFGGLYHVARFRQLLVDGLVTLALRILEQQFYFASAAISSPCLIEDPSLFHELRVFLLEGRQLLLQSGDDSRVLIHIDSLGRRTRLRLPLLSLSLRFQFLLVNGLDVLVHFNDEEAALTRLLVGG